MKVIGIDPGYAITGYAVLEGKGSQYRLRESGRIETQNKLPFSKRLTILYDSLCQLIGKHQPQSAGLEKLYFGKNTKTAMEVSHARGVIVLALEKGAIPFEEYTPNYIKKAITGTARAEKAQVQEMVKRLLGLEKIIRQDDTADAVAIALTHAAFKGIAKETRLQSTGKE